MADFFFILSSKINCHPPGPKRPSQSPLTAHAYLYHLLSQYPVLLFALWSSAYVYLFLAWLSINALSSLWVGTLPILLATLSSSLEKWQQFKCIEWINNKYFVWWTMEFPGGRLKIYSRAISLPYGKGEERQKDVKKLWSVCSLPTSLSSDSITRGCISAGALLGSVREPGGIAQLMACGSVLASEVINMLLHRHRLFLSFFLTISVLLPLFPSITGSILVGFCSTGTVNLRIFAADWTFCSWIRWNHVSLEPRKKNHPIYINPSFNHEGQITISSC